MAGPLGDCRVLELGAIGPVPFAGMLLSDLGADVVRIDRPPASGTPSKTATGDPLSRGRRSVAIDLKHPGAAGVVLGLVENVDVLIEGFRPGVMERLGIGPSECLERNPRLVYGRMTGWGQHGPYAANVGHDINFLALSGALFHIGRADTVPAPPMNLVGDFGGGGMYLALGVVAAFHCARTSGAGQVVDAAMVDGIALLTASIHGLRAQGRWSDERGTNLIDSGAPFYDVYVTADDRLVSVGALERRFYEALLRVCGLDDQWPDRFDRDAWPSMRSKLAASFRARTLAEWCDRFEGTEVCFAPVLSMEDAPHHPHNRARESFVTLEGVVQPAPGPRFDSTSLETPRPGAARPGEHTDEVLASCGVEPEELQRLRREKVVA